MADMQVRLTGKLADSIDGVERAEATLLIRERWAHPVFARKPTRRNTNSRVLQGFGTLTVLIMRLPLTKKRREKGWSVQSISSHCPPGKFGPVRPTR